MLLPAIPSKVVRRGDKLSGVLPSRGLLPTTEEWMQWHSNVITPFRTTGKCVIIVSTCAICHDSQAVALELGAT